MKNEPQPRVMVVDDSALVLRMTIRNLERLGLAAVGFEGPEAALAAMPDMRPLVIITDFSMPGMDGAAFARLASTLVSPPPAMVLITGRIDPLPSEDRALFVAVLAKPHDSRQLVAVVRGAIDRATAA